MGKRRNRAAAGRPGQGSSQAEGLKESFLELLGDDLFDSSDGNMLVDETCSENASASGPQELIRGLPDDLVRQWILPRANPASYAQMKKVSKGWRSLIEEGEEDKFGTSFLPH